jgi:hypothetical protein
MLTASTEGFPINNNPVFSSIRPEDELFTDRFTF